MLRLLDILQLADIVFLLPYMAAEHKILKSGDQFERVNTWLK